MDKKLINMQLSIELINKMDSLAKELGITRTMLVRLAVEEFIKNRSNNNGDRLYL